MKEYFRTTLRVMATCYLRIRSRPYVVNPIDPCVVISPHQDDETFGCAGLIHHSRRAGRRVEIIYITDGAASHPGHPNLKPAEVAELRRREAVAAMTLLNISTDSLHFINAPDGTLSQLLPAETTALVGRLATLLAKLQPAELFIPCAEDSSSEHKSAFRLVSQALVKTNLAPRVLQYPVWARWRPQRLFKIGAKSRRVWRHYCHQGVSLKRTAIACYTSQTQPIPPWQHAVLPRGFAGCFATPDEYFFEQ